jgi:hypothetical protein
MYFMFSMALPARRELPEAVADSSAIAAEE